MADLIALHWGTDTITAVVPTKGQGERAIVIPHSQAASDPAATGSLIKGGLARVRVSAKKVAIVLPRSAAILRKLALPDVPDEELPDLVRMQAATKSPMPLDRLRMDFVPLPKRGEGREVLLATVVARTIDDVLAAVRHAGLEPTSIGLAPFGTAAKLAGSSETTLVIAVQDLTAEITFVRDGAVLFSHVGEMPAGDLGEDGQWLLSEVSRSVIAADHLSATSAIKSLVLVGPGELFESLTQPLTERYGGEVQLFESAEKLAVTADDPDVSPAAVAAASGQLIRSGLLQVDLLNPRKRVEKPDRTRLQLSIAAAGIAAILLAAFAMSWLEQRELDNEISRLRAAKTALEADLAQGQPTLVAHDAIREWVERQADWTAELSALDSALPGTENIYLTSLTLDPGARETTGHVKGAGSARGLYDVRALDDALAAMGYKVNPTSRVESPRDPEYPIRFDLDYTIPRSSNDEPQATPPAG